LARAKKAAQPRLDIWTCEPQEEKTQSVLELHKQAKGAVRLRPWMMMLTPPLLPGSKACFMEWVSSNRAHLPKSGSFFMSAEGVRKIPNLEKEALSAGVSAIVSKSDSVALVQIPSHADQDSDVMSIRIPTSCRSRFRGYADQGSELMPIRKMIGPVMV
jgi:hypothetical protein